MLVESTRLWTGNVVELITRICEQSAHLCPNLATEQSVALLCCHHLRDDATIERGSKYDAVRASEHDGREFGLSIMNNGNGKGDTSALRTDAKLERSRGDGNCLPQDGVRWLDHETDIPRPWTTRMLRHLPSSAWS